ncbi:MAG: winged helix-turn-helix domain-containing protein [Candidatus Heimdallarchaeota archaeon]|nr:winged helix-turn-helix domain-containing protein [Candidatus Heimdallarchaeota archaeon]
MIQSVPNTLSPYYMGSFDIEITHAKLLNYLKKRENSVEKSKISFYSNGKTYHLRSATSFIADLKKEQAIIENDKTIAITDKGLKLLQNNSHLLKRISTERKVYKKYKQYKKYKNTKVRCDKAIPTEEDFRILELLKATTIDNSFTITAFAEELGLTRPLVTYRMQRLKKAKLIDYEPRKYNTIKILKEIE